MKTNALSIGIASWACVNVCGCSKTDSSSTPGLASSASPARVPSPATPPVAASTAPDACSVAMAADVAAAFGSAFTQAPGSPHTNATVSRCDWKGTGSLLMVRTEAIDKASFVESMKAMPGGVNPVSGLGDSAYFQSSHNQFFAYKGSTKVSLNFAGGGLDAAKIEADEKALMEKIVARL